MAVQTSDHDLFVEQFLLEDENNVMPLPDIEADPQLLISKVRKYYMEYIIRLLSTNYETHQKLVNKNIYLPSAIWRCAKKLEVTAAQACMVVQIYRKNIISVDSIIENHAAQIKSLDERLANLAGLLVANDHPVQKTEVQKMRRRVTSKWICEEYFLKQKLHELLDQIGDRDRKELEKVKQKFVQLFGPDGDDEEILSPLDETNEFITSCKERIAPWVVKLLTPYYIRGHIKGKLIFKALAKHLIRLIYQCSRYPEQYEVNSFVSDFLKNHKTIRCEADFKEFRIENI